MQGHIEPKGVGLKCGFDEHRPACATSGDGRFDLIVRHGGTVADRTLQLHTPTLPCTARDKIYQVRERGSAKADARLADNFI